MYEAGDGKCICETVMIMLFPLLSVCVSFSLVCVCGASWHAGWLAGSEIRGKRKGRREGGKLDQLAPSIHINSLAYVSYVVDRL